MPGGHLKAADPVAVLRGAAARRDMRRADQAQRRAEGLREGGDRPGDADPAGPGVGAGHLDTEPAEHAADQLHVRLVRAVPRREFVAAERRRARDDLVRQFFPAAGDQRHLDPRGAVQFAGRLGTVNGPTLAAGQRHEGILGHDPLP